MEPQSQTKKSIVPVVIIIGIIVVALAFGLMQYTKKNVAVVVPIVPTVPSVPVTSPVTNPSATTPVDVKKIPPVVSPYKNGTYTAVGQYNAPSGTESIGVEVALKDGIITDVIVTPQARNGTSRRYQQTVAQNIKQYVVGKSITAVQLDRVSGSSLTPQGWNDAVAQILVQAKV